MHEVYKALYNCAPPDVVFSIDQSASMYRPAYATKDLQCDDSFSANRTQESTPETIAATGELSRAEFIQKMKTDAEFAERATHYGYYIARSAGHKERGLLSAMMRKPVNSTVTAPAEPIIPLTRPEPIPVRILQELTVITVYPFRLY